jgi:hypothetical protein
MSLGMTAQIQCSLLRGGELLAEGSINVMAGTPEEARRAMEDIG